MESVTDILRERAEFWTQESQRLAADACGDESNFMKIRANICGICDSVFRVHGLAKGMVVMRGIQSTWERALTEASEHNDTERVLTEEVKLEALQEIYARLEGVQEA